MEDELADQIVPDGRMDGWMNENTWDGNSNAYDRYVFWDCFRACRSDYVLLCHLFD